MNGDNILLELLRMGRAAVRVDVETIGGGVDDDDLSARGSQRGRSDVARRSIGGVNDDP